MARFFTLVFLGLVPLWAADAPIIREPNVVYLSDFDLPPLKLKVAEPAPSYFSAALKNYAGTLRPGQEVLVLAVGEKSFQVRGRAQQGQVLAWVDPGYLEGMPDGLVGKLREAEKRRLLVEELVKKNEVAIGMTPAEVGRSLGKPQKITKRADKDHSQQVWEYVKYITVPQQVTSVGPNGQAIFTTIYVKQPAGTLQVVFDADAVSALEQTEGVVLGGGQVTVVPAPIVVY